MGDLTTRGIESSVIESNSAEFVHITMITDWLGLCECLINGGFNIVIYITFNKMNNLAEHGKFKSWN